MELHDLAVLPRVQALHPDLPWLPVLQGYLVHLGQVALVGHSSGLAPQQRGAADIKLDRGGGLSGQAGQSQESGGDHGGLEYQQNVLTALANIV